MSYQSETRRRRTFAIISHPDAGKTTLTEKLLLFSGAIQIAGSVKARKASRHATSDWMEIEKQRGISVASSVMQMLYRDHVINLLDTPGHKDFSEDTYRVLTAVDSALMVIDAANGVEAQTRRLIEVCRQRDTPIITFVNKMDREVREPLDILDEVDASNAFVQYDIYHAQRTEGEIAATLQRHLSRIGHVQLADNPGRHEPGTGEINYRYLFAHLDRIGYDGWVGCEYKPARTTEIGLNWRAVLPA